MPKTIRGTTEGGSSAILGAAFWKLGKSVTGTYLKSWESSVGECYTFTIDEGMPLVDATINKDGRITEDGDASGKKVQLEKFSIGGLKGFQIALDHLKQQGCILQFRDQCKIVCTGYVESAKEGKEDMAQFAIEVTR